jgi:flagellar motor switch protein FliN
MSYADCWTKVATDLFAQALAGEPQLAESLPKPLGAGSFAFAATVAGDEAGRFVMVLDGGILETTLMGDGVDQKAGWAELLREVAEAAAGELLATTGRKCRVEKFESAAPESQISRAYQLRAGDRSFVILVRDDVRDAARAAQPAASPAPKAAAATPAAAAMSGGSISAPPYPQGAGPGAGVHAGLHAGLSPGLELLLDVELEASLRFGSREMPLGEILDLGPGDVVQLDRHVADPVDLLVGDKIVARGEVVLINGNFGLRVTEVAEPRKRLESIRCLF